MKEGSWLLGGGWNNDLWGGELPSASSIDDITPHHPLSRMDGHMGLANSLALKLVGVTSNMQDPVGVTISRNANGEPSGLMIDSAMKVVLSCIPEVSVEERRQALDRASRCLQMGLFISNNDDQGLPFSFQRQHGHDIIQKTGRRLSQWIFLGGVKAFSDGSLGSNSAIFHKPYADEPWNIGLQVTYMESLSNMTVQSDKYGLKVAIHAIGDKANDLILDMYKSVVSTNGNRDQRFRIEHAQHLSHGSAAKFGEQGIVASVQVI
ncbi:unnamed protein product [Lactuca virosa]|uniref:Amidohydrolase 3 domain-containing protein n=1 Tax=Lactuca virosa TaxID=75947 RepID=A0AAU9PQR6_9ASTR|nr:unnamed protein product [Lactuca virosa]